ncbi:MAG: condensation domain-containing protein [Pyrinomonadaceae bacterium]
MSEQKNLIKRKSNLSPAKLALLEKWKQGLGETKAIQRRTHEGPVPLSFAQEQLYYFYQLAPDSHIYNMQMNTPIKRLANVSVLLQCLNEVLKRHESLRTTFTLIDGKPFQLISPYQPIDLPVVDLREFPKAEREAEAKRLASQELKRVFDLSRDVILRPLLLRMEGNDHILLLTMHHIASDGWSLGILSRELFALFKAFDKGQPSPLPELPVQYADFALWQRENLQADGLERQLAYWKRQLSGSLPFLNLPADWPRPPVPSFRGGQEQIVLPKELTEALKNLSEREGVSMFMLMLAAFLVLLYRYTYQESLTIGSPIANRSRRELEGLIGFFANTIVMSTDMSGNPTFLELLRRVREVATGAYAHQDLPYEKLVEALQPERDQRYNSLFQVVFAFQNVPAMGTTRRAEFRPLDIESDVARVDLECYVWEDAGSLHVRFVYSTDLFNASTIRRMLGQYQTLLDQINEHPEVRISRIQLLPTDERERVLSASMPLARQRGEISAFMKRRLKEVVEEVAAGAQLAPRGELS